MIPPSFIGAALARNVAIPLQPKLTYIPRKLFLFLPFHNVITCLDISSSLSLSRKKTDSQYSSELDIMRFISDDPNARDLSYKGGLKVITTGLSRCATSSLQYVLENDLGFGPCMHMAYVVPHTKMLKLCHEALLETDKAKRQKILHTIFDGYQSTSDFPGIAFADDLMEMYPDAKVILNKRDSAQKWLKSITGTIKFFSEKRYMLMCYLWSTDYWHWKVHQAAKVCWNRRFNLGDSADGIFVLESYDRHNNWVHEAAEKNGSPILEWRPDQGWEPICTFLDKPVPQKPFPKMNDENTMRVLTAVIVTRGLLSWAALLASPALAYWGWTRFLKT